jgi:hypothetical protein
MARRAIDLEGLPEEALKDVAAYVAAIRKRYEDKKNGGPAQGRVYFNVQPGTVYGDRTREDIYDDER